MTIQKWSNVEFTYHSAVIISILAIAFSKKTFIATSQAVFAGVISAIGFTIYVGKSGEYLKMPVF